MLNKHKYLRNARKRHRAYSPHVVGDTVKSDLDNLPIRARVGEGTPP